MSGRSGNRAKNRKSGHALLPLRHNHELNMHDRGYSGPKGSADVSPLEKSPLLFKEFAVLDGAPSCAIFDALRAGMREQHGG
jgi:hypothetical protein